MQGSTSVLTVAALKRIGMTVSFLALILNPLFNVHMPSLQ